MTERPILFSAPMVRAILDGSKTQTRRIVAQQPADSWEFERPLVLGLITEPKSHPKAGKFGAFLRRTVNGFPEVDIVVCPYGQPGDRLWVRETWQGPLWLDEEDGEYSPAFCKYAADGEPAPEFIDSDDNVRRCWRPSIHMPRWASRITMEITGVRVERLQEISETDAMAEGVKRYNDRVFIGSETEREAQGFFTARDAFADIWESINGAGSWGANPWVWVVEFRRVQP